MAKQMPRYTAAELEGELAQYFGDQDMEHRRPSAVATGADVAAPRTA
jgi:hypothetical protein